MVNIKRMCTCVIDNSLMNEVYHYLHVFEANSRTDGDISTSIICHESRNGICKITSDICNDFMSDITLRD